MAHSWDIQEVGMAHVVKVPETSLNIFPVNDGAGKTKPKQALRSTQNAFKKFPRNLEFFYLTEFSTD